MVDAEVKIEAEGILTALERIPLFEPGRRPRMR